MSLTLDTTNGLKHTANSLSLNKAQMLQNVYTYSTENIEIGNSLNNFNQKKRRQCQVPTWHDDTQPSAELLSIWRIDSKSGLIVVRPSMCN